MLTVIMKSIWLVYKDIFEILLGKLWNKFQYASQEHCDFYVNSVDIYLI